MSYDYMQAYFQFLKAEDAEDAEQFANLREIISNYEDCPVKHFKILFNKLLEQLNEIDESN